MRLSLIVLLGLMGVACAEKTEEFVAVPLNCTIPGDLELAESTTDLLQKYQRLDDEVLPESSSVNSEYLNKFNKSNKFKTH